jgi:hypothetical protein
MILDRHGEVEEKEKETPDIEDDMIDQEYEEEDTLEDVE